MSTITYRIDIDGTIAEPRFFDDDFQSCVNLYVRAGILKIAHTRASRPRSFYSPS